MSKRKVLAVGDHVYAKWPGSSKYYKGVVVEYDDEQDAYDVKFDDDDDTLLVPAKNVYAEKSFLSRARSASPSRVTPTSRGQKQILSKSPSGSPRRPRSPGRRPIGGVVQVQSDQSFLLRGHSASPSRVTPTSQEWKRSVAKSPSDSQERQKSPDRRSISAIVQVPSDQSFLLRGRSASPSRGTPISRGRRQSLSKSPSGSPRRPRSPARKSIGAVVQVQSDQSFAKATGKKGALLDEAIATIIEARPSLQAPSSEVEGVKYIGKNFKELSPGYTPKGNPANMVATSGALTVTENMVVNRRITQAYKKSLTKDATQVNEGKQEQIKQYCLSILNGLCCISKFGLELFIAVVFLTSMISLVYGLHFACKSTLHCTFLELPQIPSQATFYSWLSTSYVFGWYLLQAILFILPVGKIIQGPLLKDKSRHYHRLNGTIQLVVSFLLTGILVYSGHLPSKHITSLYTSMITATILFGFLMSMLVLIQQRLSLPASSSGTLLSDFVYGRSAYPTLLKTFNVKAYGFRTGMISWVILVLIHFAEYCAKLRNGEWPNVAVVLHVLMNILYVSYHFVFEESAYYTATFTNEKVGALMIVTLFTFFPFFYSSATKYLTMFPPTYPHFVCYAFPVIVFGIGFYIYHSATTEKLRFRKQPSALACPGIGFYIYHSATTEKLRFRKQPSALACPGVDCILTQDGKNILVGGWWGRLRHPNYFADLLMAYSLAGICGFVHLLPWVYPLLLTVMLMFMARQDDFLCKEKYGQSWVEYQRRVKYKLLPFVY